MTHLDREAFIADLVARNRPRAEAEAIVDATITLIQHRAAYPDLPAALAAQLPSPTMGAATYEGNGVPPDDEWTKLRAAEREFRIEHAARQRRDDEYQHRIEWEQVKRDNGVGPQLDPGRWQPCELSDADRAWGWTEEWDLTHPDELRIVRLQLIKGSWHLYASNDDRSGENIVTADDLEAAARIIRAHEGQGRPAPDDGLLCPQPRTARRAATAPTDQRSSPGVPGT